MEELMESEHRTEQHSTDRLVPARDAISIDTIRSISGSGSGSRCTFKRDVYSLCLRSCQKGFKSECIWAHRGSRGEMQFERWNANVKASTLWNVKVKNKVKSIGREQSTLYEPIEHTHRCGAHVHQVRLCVVHSKRCPCAPPPSRP